MPAIAWSGPPPSEAVVAALRDQRTAIDRSDTEGLPLVVAAPPTLAPEVSGGLGTVGVRVPAHDVTRALAAAAGVPLTATSANISGQPATNDPEAVLPSLGNRLDVLVDAGVTAGGAPSTIIDATGETPRLIRAGAIPWDAVLTASRRA